MINHQGGKVDLRSVSCSVETPQFTFTLPDLTRYTEDFRGFLEKDLIEMSALISLEQMSHTSSPINQYFLVSDGSTELVGGYRDVSETLAPGHHGGRQLSAARRQPGHVGLP